MPTYKKTKSMQGTARRGITYGNTHDTARYVTARHWNTLDGTARHYFGRSFLLRGLSWCELRLGKRTQASIAQRRNARLNWCDCYNNNVPKHNANTLDVPAWRCLGPTLATLTTIHANQDVRHLINSWIQTDCSKHVGTNVWWISVVLAANNYQREARGA